MRVSIEGAEDRQLWIEPDRNGEYVRWNDVLPFLMAASVCSGMNWQEWRDQTGLPDAVCRRLERICAQADDLTVGVEWSQMLADTHGQTMSLM